VVAVGLVLGFNWLRFGAPLMTGYPLRAWPGSQLWLEAAALIVSPGKGLLVFFPLAALSVPGLLRLCHRSRDAAVLLAGLLAGLVAFYGAIPAWVGLADPMTWGPRYFVPVLPLLALTAALWVSGRSVGHRGVYALLSASGFAITLSGILFDFVPHYRWVHGTLGLPVTNIAQFEPVISPLVSGWTSPARTWDLFWLLEPRLVPPLAELARQARAELELDLSSMNPLWGWLVPLGLAAVLLWTARGLAHELRGPR
jgi:hypothetical protein